MWYARTTGSQERDLCKQQRQLQLVDPCSQLSIAGSKIDPDVTLLCVLSFLLFWLQLVLMVVETV
jgi:hypothetical protein